jgi:hypothetical protein
VKITIVTSAYLDMLQTVITVDHVSRIAYAIFQVIVMSVKKDTGWILKQEFAKNAT